MYSLVLVMAMSHGAAAPGWQSGEVDLRGTNFIHASAHQHYRGCHGCHGCHGCCGGCYGGGCCGGGCYGGGCYGGGWGCCGGGYGGCYGGGRYGGGCYGGGCYGGGYAYGGYGGGYGGYTYSMPYGGYSGYAGMPAYGGYTSGYYTPGTNMPATGTPGVSGPGGQSGSSGGAAPVDRGDRRDEGDRGRRDEDRNKEVLAPTPATLIVTLPADAKLLIDDTATRSTSATRTFMTPPLEPGREFHYTLKAETRRGDEPVTVTRDVTVRAGQETRVTLDFASASVAQK
jgi:uncharacterized protein (TIGR03000 family)